MIPGMPILAIVWRDTCSENGWRSTEEALLWAREKAALEYRTVGYFVGEDDGFVCLAATTDPDGPVNDVSMIPRSAIIRVEKVEPSPTPS